MENYIIYKLTSPSGKIYIGRTDDFDRRMIEHKAISKKDKIRHLYKWVRKHGWNNFIKEIIDTADTLDDAISKELKYILEFDTVKSGYNCTYETKDGGDIWNGLRDTQKYTEYVEKMSEITSGENNGMYGKNQTEETKKLQREKAKGRFSLPWFIERYGEEEGNSKYEDRCLWLKSRSLPRDNSNRFIKKELS
jgi:group I intron endonuclease